MLLLRLLATSVPQPLFCSVLFCSSVAIAIAPDVVAFAQGIKPWYKPCYTRSVQHGIQHVTLRSVWITRCWVWAMAGYGPVAKERRRRISQTTVLEGMPKAKPNGNSNAIQHHISSRWMCAVYVCGTRHGGRWTGNGGRQREGRGSINSNFRAARRKDCWTLSRLLRIITLHCTRRPHVRTIYSSTVAGTGGIGCRGENVFFFPFLLFWARPDSKITPIPIH